MGRNRSVLLENTKKIKGGVHDFHKKNISTRDSLENQNGQEFFVQNRFLKNFPEFVFERDYPKISVMGYFHGTVEQTWFVPLFQGD